MRSISVGRILTTGLFKRTSVYTFSASFNALVAFLLLPVLTRYLSPYDFGIIETFIAVTACLTCIIIIGGNTLLAKEYFNLSNQERETYISNILGLIVLSSVLLFTIFLLTTLTSDFWLKYVKLSNTLIILSIGVSLSSAFSVIVLTLFQLEKNSKLYALFVNTKIIVDITISLLLIIVYGLTWQGRIAGISSSAFLFFGIGFLVFKKRNIKASLPLKYGKRILMLGLPLIVAQIAGWINQMVDRLMINNFIDVESTGLYSVGYRFGMIIMIIATAFGRAWLPFFYENVSKNTIENNVKIVKATYIYLVSLIVLALIFGYTGKYLLYILVDEKFHSAGDYIFLISMAYCFQGIWIIFNEYLIFNEKTAIYSYIVVVSGAINISLNYILLKKIGVIGAAWATFVSFGVCAMLSIIGGIICHPMPWLLGVSRTSRTK